MIKIDNSDVEDKIMSNQNIDSIMSMSFSFTINIHVIRVASSMLKNKKDHFVLYISDTKRTLSDSNQQQLDKNIAYAKQLGAEVEIVSSEDIAQVKFLNLLIYISK